MLKFKYKTKKQKKCKKQTNAKLNKKPELVRLT